MSMTLTPPPATPPTGPAAPTGPGGLGGPVGPGGPRRSAPRVIAILAIVAGAVVLAVAIVTAVVSTVWGGRVETAALTADVDGVTSIAVDGSAADIEVAFADVAEAELTVTGSRGAEDWAMTRSGGELVIESDRWWWPDWRLWDGGTRAVLLLPRDLEGLDASLEADAGSLTAEGRFGDLNLSLGAGTLTASGSADTVELDVDAGTANIDLADVSTAVIDLSAGRVVGGLTGQAPTSLDLQVDAGSADLELPDDTYAISARTDAGSFSHTLDEVSSSRHRIDARVSAGSIVLSPAR